MLDKNTNRKNWKETRKNLGFHIQQLRMQKGLTLEDMNYETRLPLRALDNLESGYCDLYVQELLVLAKFFEKKVKIELVD